MEARYKDVFLTYRNEVKPLIAQIESERSSIPDHVVPDTALMFEAIAMSEAPGLSDGQREDYISKARNAIQHCLSGCYQQLLAARLRRIEAFRMRADRSALMGIDRGTPYNVIENGLKRFEELCSQCDTSPEADTERQISDLPLYKEAYEALQQPYEMVCKYEPDINISITATPRRLSNARELGIAIKQGVIWALVVEGVIGAVRLFIKYIAQ